MNRLKGTLLILCSLLLYLLAAATLFTMLRSFTVRDTLSAVESAFGTLVIGIILLALAWRSLKAGKARLLDKPSDEPPG